MSLAAQIADEASARLSALADPVRAVPMAAYLKTKMPFYGVQAAPRRAIGKDLSKAYIPDSAAEYEAIVLALWAKPHREEKYLAVQLARAYKKFIVPAQLPLYEQLIRQGAWWDFVDEITAHLVCPLVVKHPEVMWPLMDQWIVDESMWVRRAAILCQLNAKGKTLEDKLFEYCLMRAEEEEFFIRKAIGWALRQYAYQAPDAVRSFVAAHAHQLSGLSRREAMKHL